MDTNLKSILLRIVNSTCCVLSRNGVTLYGTVADNGDGRGTIFIYGYGTDAVIITLRIRSAVRSIIGKRYGDDRIIEGTTDSLGYKTLYTMINF